MDMFNNHLMNNSEMLYSPEEEGYHEDTAILPASHSNQHSFCAFANQTTNRSSSASDVMLPNVFVQIPIHTHSHSISRQNREIKCEPIKSECDNRSLTPLSIQTSTALSTTSATTQHLSAVTTNVLCSQQQQSSELNIITPALVTARPKPSIKCFKCTLCPFISISQSGLDSHTASCHQNDTFDTMVSSAKRKVSCPGCENVFYSKKSLKIHLVNDHQMSHTEMMLLLSESSTAEDNARSDSDTEPINKQKIYLKNVEVLKNPIFSVSTTQSSEEFPPFPQFNETNQMENYSTDPSMQLIELIDDEFPPLSQDLQQTESSIIDTATSEFHNKIYVKNDNILKMPDAVNNQFNFATNSFDYGLPSLNFDGGDSNVLNIIETPPPPITPQISISSDETIVSSPSTVPKKSCKIFIKNVDILKKPMSLQPSIASDSSSFNAQPHQFFNNSNHIELPIIPSAFGGMGNFDTTTFTYRASPPRFVHHQTPPATNQQKKIFIKNIDILKKPIENTQLLPEPPQLPINQVQQETTKKSTLHLRTVDELNLMNITEVQNLIENYQEEEPNESESRIPTNDTENEEEYSEIPDYLCNNTDDIHPNDQCLESVIQDFVSDFRPDKTDHFQFPIQCIQDNSQNSFGKESNILAFQSNGMLSSVNNNVVFDNIIDSTTSSMDEKTSRSDQLSRENSTPDTAPLYYSTFSDNFQGSNEESDRSSQAPLIDYERAFSEEILFVDEIVNSNASIVDVESIFQVNADNDIGSMDIATNVRDESSTNQIANKIEQNFNQNKDKKIQKGRIYVVANLLKEPNPSPSKMIENIETASDADSMMDSRISDDIVNLVDDDKRKRKTKKHIGRPRGLRKIDLAIRGNDDTRSGQETFYKCTQDCAMYFRSEETLNFHERCHDPVHKTKIICPECKQNDFKVWNTLHTHLWRQHQIDMDLYSCELCSFRTPILSRLLNTHMKIHSDERNFKCSQCEKAFKNTKQLKNHRRIHTQVATIRKCDICDILFYNQKHLLDHIRSFHQKQEKYKCDVCSLRFSSINARETHCLNHKNTSKYRCNDCSYTSNDINAYRRHKMTHTEDAGYICKYCNFKSIQSSTYMKHVVRSHPEEADKIVFSCTKCKFITINKRRFDLHVLNHDFTRNSDKDNEVIALSEQEYNEEF